MKKLFLITAMFIATSVWAYNETDLLKFNAINICKGCDLSGADLRVKSGSSRGGTNLEGSNLSKANLTKVDFSGGANFRKVNLAGADLTKTNLIGVNLREANLTGANLRKASLSRTILEGANLTDTDLTEAYSLWRVKLDGAIFCRTKTPWGELNDGC